MRSLLILLVGLCGLACTGLATPAASLQVETRYYFDRDLQPELGVDVDYAVTFHADGTFTLEDEGHCQGVWRESPPGLLVLELRSASDPDGNPMDLELCWAPGEWRVVSPDLLRSREGFEFRALP